MRAGAVRVLSHALQTTLIASAGALALRLTGHRVDVPLLLILAGSAALGAALSPRLYALVSRVFGAKAPALAAGRPAHDEGLAALRRRLERAEKLAIAGELAASVAHEIKNPLAPIRGYAQLLEGRLGAVDPTERAVFAKGLAVIRAETDRIVHRVEGLLRAARGDREPSSPDDTTALEATLLEALAVAAGEAGGLRLVHRLEPGLGRVVGNGDLLRGAFLNLIKNALEAMADASEEGSVEVYARRAEGRAVVEIVDQGPGLRADAAERVFEAFFTTKAEGTGLGLTIARSAVEAAGGELSLGNRPDLRGAVARVVLDLAPPPRDGGAGSP